jgi:hemolysin III
MKNGGSAAAGRIPILWPSPDGDNATEPSTKPVIRPRWRGRLHQAAFLASIPAGLSLVVVSPSLAARAAAAVYAISLSAMYATSAAFHRIDWGPAAWRWMRRLDHSMIFVLIAGSYTPFAVLGLAPPWSTVVLGVVWGGAALGILVRLLSEELGVLPGTLYLVLGWIGALVLPFAADHLTGVQIGLMVGGGLCYTIGAILFWLNRPVLRPQVFGYHELWHVLVVSGSACHYVLILLLVLQS